MTGLTKILVIVIPAVVIILTLGGVLMVNRAAILKSETLMIRALVGIAGLILAGVLIGLWQYGIDLSTVFLGTPWDSPLSHTRGAIAIEGGIVAVTLIFGGLFVGGIMALIKKV